VNNWRLKREQNALTVHCHNQHNYIISKTDVKNPKVDGKSSLEVLTAVVLKTESLWDVTLCWLVSSYQHFDGSVFSPSGSNISHSGLPDHEAIGSTMLSNVSNHLPVNRVSILHKTWSIMISIKTGMILKHSVLEVEEE